MDVHRMVPSDSSVSLGGGGFPQVLLLLLRSWDVDSVFSSLLGFFNRPANQEGTSQKISTSTGRPG